MLTTSTFTPIAKLLPVSQNVQHLQRIAAWSTVSLSVAGYPPRSTPLLHLFAEPRGNHLQQLSRPTSWQP